MFSQEIILNHLAAEIGAEKNILHVEKTGHVTAGARSGWISPLLSKLNDGKTFTFDTVPENVSGSTVFYGHVYPMIWMNKIFDKSLRLLGSKDLALFLSDERILSDEAHYRKELEERGYFINAVFASPFLDEWTKNLPRNLVIVLSKTEKDDVFLVDLEHNCDLSGIIKNYHLEISSNLNTGMILNREVVFRNFSFDKYKKDRYQEMVQRTGLLVTAYTLQEITQDISFIEDSATEPNTAFLLQPKIGIPYFDIEYDEARIDVSRSFKLKLKEDFVFSEYLITYLNTKKGGLSWRTQHAYKHEPGDASLDDPEFRASILQSLGEIRVFLPPERLQREIASTINNATRIKDTLIRFEEQISADPEHVQDLKEDIDGILQAVERVSEQENLRALIQEGEHDQLEFKPSARYSKKPNVSQEEVQSKIVRTICGFLNANGGTLLVGVHDRGAIIGISQDKFETDDETLKHISNLTKEFIGPDAFRFIQSRIMLIDGKKVLKIVVQPGDTPAWFNRHQEESFLVRNGATTQTLTPKDASEYIRRRFS